VTVLDDPSQLAYPSPAVNAAGNDAVFVGRIREDISYDHGLCLWVVSDNIRKGAALNSVQIADKLIKILDIESVRALYVYKLPAILRSIRYYL